MRTQARRCALAFALGAIAFLAFAPYGLYPLILVLLAGLAYLGTAAANGRQAAGIGYCFGLGYFLFGVSWVFISMHDFGGMPVPAAAFATGFFCAYLALFPAVACAGLAWNRLPLRWRLLLLFPALWALGEWSRGWIFTGFPWLAAGYSQVPEGPLGHYAAVLGVYGVSWLTVALAAGVTLMVRAWRAARMLPMAVVLLILSAGYGLGQIRWTQPTGEAVSVSLLQGNIEQSIKWQPEKARDTLRIYLEMTRAARTKLILLPETALPLFNVDVPPEYLRALAEHAIGQGGDLLLGVPELASRDTYYNSVMSLGSSPSRVYRKSHLVPFGDYFPNWPVLASIMHTLEIPMSSFSRGAAYQEPIAAAGLKIAVNICYEDVFGEEIIRQLPAATVLANFTNDAWWGESKASDQHMQISQMRARETGRYMLRATNTGVSAIIDERGHVLAVAPQFVRTIVQGRAQGFAGATPYTRWGNAAFLTLALTALGACLIRARLG